MCRRKRSAARAPAGSTRRASRCGRTGSPVSVPSGTAVWIAWRVYLVHYVIVLMVFGGAVVLGAWLGFDPIVERGPHGASLINMPSLWAGDLASLVFLGATIGVSWCTYSLIEKPGRDWFNGLAKKTFPTTRAPPAP